jgi:hypothetical protein
VSAREALYAALCARGTEHVAAVDLINNHNAEELNKAADTIATDRDTTNPSAGKGAYRRGMNRAEDIVRRLAAGAGEKSSPAGADATPDFFQPGHTYGKGQDGYKAPEQTWQFRCVAIADHPREDAGRRAFGFMRQGLGPWESVGVREGEYERGWTDITGAGETA